MLFLWPGRLRAELRKVERLRDHWHAMASQAIDAKVDLETALEATRSEVASLKLKLASAETALKPVEADKLAAFEEQSRGLQAMVEAQRITLEDAYAALKELREENNALRADLLEANKPDAVATEAIDRTPEERFFPELEKLFAGISRDLPDDDPRRHQTDELLFLSRELWKRFQR